jgi:hypothetical protein
MRIGAKNSTPVTDRKHFLVRFDAEKGFISSVCATLDALSRGATSLPERCDVRKVLENKGARSSSTCTDESSLTECFAGLRDASMPSALCARLQMRAVGEACDELGATIGCCANYNILVSAGNTARQH